MSVESVLLSHTKIRCRHSCKQAVHLQLGEKNCENRSSDKRPYFIKALYSSWSQLWNRRISKKFYDSVSLLFWNSFVQRLASWTFCYCQRSNASFERIRKSIKVRRWRYDWCPWTKTIHWTVYLHCIITAKFFTWK